MELYHFPTDLEQIIREAADGAPDDERQVAESVLALADLFVGRVPWQGEYSATPELRRAYLRYYLPVNLPKIRVPLGEWLRADRRRLARETLRCLDLGSGPGTALLGLVDFLRALPAAERPTRLDLVALDQSYENLKDAELFLRRLAERTPELAIRFQPLRVDLVADRSRLFPLAAAGGPFDLVIAENVLCEIVRDSPDGFERAAALISKAAEELLAADGAILIVEPALRETARDLHRLRDRWLESTSLHVRAPCLHEAACPALATDRDWCIVELPWEPPEIVSSIDRRTGLRKGALKFAYLVLAPDAPAAATALWRVVSDVLDLKGERRVYLCAEGRWIVLRQLKRDKGTPSDSLAALRRGDLIEIQGMVPKGALFQLPANGSIRRIGVDR